MFLFCNSKYSVLIFIIILYFYSGFLFSQSCRKILPDEINSYQPAIVPVLNSDGNKLYFDRKIHPDNTGSIRDEDEIWVSNKLSENSWSEPVRLPSPINTKESNVLFTLSPDGSSALIYTENLLIEDSLKSGFALIHRIKDKWSEPEFLVIDEYYNLSKNFYGSISYDKNILILSLERKDGHGQLDLFYSYRINNNSWSKPENLGLDINTKFDEASPYLAYDNKTLYFSSKRPGGMGGSDLYISRRLDNSWKHWSKPENLGKIINTEFDESSIYLNITGDTALIVSADTSRGRAGIYQVCIPKKLQPESYTLLTGSIYLENNNKNNLIKDEIRFKINTENDSDKYIFSNDPSNSRYWAVLQNNIKYKIKLDSNFYFLDDFNITTPALDSVRIIRQDFILKNKPKEKLDSSRLLNIILFDTDCWKLSDSACLVLNNLKNYKTKNILIIGHTDDTGADRHNIKLSKRRAEAVEQYLYNLDFDIKYIELDWKGSSEPISKDNMNLYRSVEIIYLVK